MNYRPIISGIASFPLMGLLLFIYKNSLLAFLFIALIGFANGLIVQKDLTKSVLVFSFIGIIFAGALFSWALIYPYPGLTVEPNEDEGTGTVFFLPISGKIALAVLAAFSFILLFLIVPIFWISGLIGSKTRMRFNQRNFRKT